MIPESDDDWVDEFLRESAESGTGHWGPSSPEELAERALMMPYLEEMQAKSLLLSHDIDIARWSVRE